ncbi:hypothetical protein Q672_09220 [Marinobacter sp. EVN1]|nr:hypothetical protein Q672_09220 [Marinobacter sp. EVN1]
MRQNFDTRVVKTIKPIECTVSRPIINNQILEITVFLANYRLDCVLQKCDAIECRGDDTDQRLL